MRRRKRDLPSVQTMRALFRQSFYDVYSRPRQGRQVKARAIFLNHDKLLVLADALQEHGYRRLGELISEEVETSAGGEEKQSFLFNRISKALREIETREREATQRNR